MTPPLDRLLSLPSDSDATGNTKSSSDGGKYCRQRLKNEFPSFFRHIKDPPPTDTYSEIINLRLPPIEGGEWFVMNLQGIRLIGISRRWWVSGENVNNVIERIAPDQERLLRQVAFAI